MTAVASSRLTLRPLRIDDVAAFHTIWSDHSATQWSIHERCATLEASATWMSGALRTPQHPHKFSWAVYITPQSAPDDCIGLVTLLPDKGIFDGTWQQAEGDDNAPTWELGYLFRAEYWGKGYATEACEAGIAELKREREMGADKQGGMPALGKVMARVHPENNGSMRVLQKLGLKEFERMNGGRGKKWLSGSLRDDDYVTLERDI